MTRTSSLLWCIALLLASFPASAQPAGTGDPPPPPGPAAPAPAATAATPVPPPPPPPSAPTSASASTPAPASATAAADGAPPAASPPLAVFAFVDAYGSFNTNLPRPEHGATRLHAFDGDAGFSLAWLGVNVDYATEKVGATVHLRVGPASRVYALKDAGSPIELAKQAYVTYKPVANVAIDLGKFDSPFGFEVGDSQSNWSYTRAFLYTLGQPFFHTGLRGTATIASAFEIKAIAVNGWNVTVDDNRAKSLGLQLGWVGRSDMSVRLGAIAGAEQPDVVQGANGAQVVVSGANGRLRKLVDLVATYDPTGSLHLAFNADYATEATVGPTAKWYGAMLAAHVTASDTFGVGLRGEWYRDQGGISTGLANDVTLTSGALTLEATPAKNLLVRLEPRLDHADSPVFRKGFDGSTRTQPTITLGVVARTD